jgi:hypothetical protein
MFSASWSLPADAGSPIVEARYQLCQAGTCGAVRSAPSLTGVSGLSLPAAGDATLRVWLVDQLGHELPTAGATMVLNYTPPVIPCVCDTPQPQPQPQPTPNGPGPPPAPTTPTKAKTSPSLKLTTLRRVGRRVTVRGTVSTKASGRVTVRYRIRSHGRTRTLTKRVSISRHAFRTTLTLSPTYAAARTATVSVAYGGDADTSAQTRTKVLRTRA